MKLTIILLALSLSGYAQTDHKELYLIANNSGFTIAKLTVINNDIQELRDYKGEYLGRYVARMNTTYDCNGAVLGSGNLISLFLNKDN